MMLKSFVIMVIVAVVTVRPHSLPDEKRGDDSREGRGDRLDNGSGRDMDHDEDRPCSRDQDRPPRVWTFGFGRQWAPFEQLDTDHMKVVGFGIDIIHHACEVARQQCEFVFFKDYNTCWNNELEMSPALDYRWYDGCANYNPTFESSLMYAFSREYTRNIDNALFIRENDDLYIGQLEDENNYQFGLVTDYYPTTDCLYRHGITVREEQTRYYISPEALMEGLRSGEVRIAFTLDLGVDRERFRKLDTRGLDIKCTLGGLSMMARKDNHEMMHWLNPAIERVMSSPAYSRACYVWEQIFGIETYCFEDSMDGRNERSDEIDMRDNRM